MSTQIKGKTESVALPVSLRDWFAGQAIGPYLASKPADATYDEVAERCYRAADALIKARKNPAGETALHVAASDILAAIDRTNFYDLGTCDAPEDGGENCLPDDSSVDGGSSPLTAGHVRRLREALRCRS